MGFRTLHENLETVFCCRNCSDLLWEKIVLVMEKNFWNSRLKAEIFQNFEITCALFMSYSTRVELRNCRRTLFTIFWLGISYRGDPNRKQSILALKSQQVIFTMIFCQNSNAVWSKVNTVWRQFLSSTRVEYDMKDTYIFDDFFIHFE